MIGFLIRVGIDSAKEKGIGFCAPVFINDECHFEYIPVHEDDPSSETRTYSNTEIRNKKYGRYMSDFMDDKDKRWPKEDPNKYTYELKLHYDPEFETYTFGDYWSSVQGRIPYCLKDLTNTQSTYLFFYAGLSEYDPEINKDVYKTPRTLYRIADFQHRNKAPFLIGYFKIKKIIDLLERDDGWKGLESELYNNAHFKRGEDDSISVVIKGDERDSKLLTKALRLYFWSTELKKYAPSDIGKKLELRPNSGVRVKKWLNDEQTRFLLDEIKKSEQ